MKPFGSSGKRMDWGTAVLLLISLVASIAYLGVGLARVFYPYALDFIEEGMLMQAWRVAQGLPVFVPPNANFVPQVYMPLFTWLGGQLLRLTDFAFWPLRLISFLSTVGTAVLIFYIGWREGGSKTTAFAGSALFLAGYRLVGGWYDLARVDALFTFLCLAGLVVLVYGWKSGTQSYTEKPQRGTEIWVVWGAFLLGLAFLTKQHGMFLVIVVGFYLLITESIAGLENSKKSMSSRYTSVFSRILLLFVAPFAIVAGIPILLWQLSSGGWFSYYVVTVAFANPILVGRLRNIFLWELGTGMGVLVGLGAILVLQRVGSFFRGLEIRDWRLIISNSPWLVFGGTAVFISVAGRTTVGGNLNNMMIGYAFLCLIPALSWGSLSKITQIKKIRKKSAKSVDEKFARLAWLTAVLIQFVLVTFPLNGALPQAYWPTAEMRAAGDALLARVEKEPGEVWLLLHPSFAVRAGKRPYVHLQSLWHGRYRGADPLPPDLVALIEQQHFAQIISDESDYFETEPAFLELLLAHYEVAETLSPEESPPMLSGPTTRPLTIYVPSQ